ncbi:MAG: TolB family protein [Chloroflexota bacterium]
MDSPPALVMVDVESGQTLWELRRFSPGERHIPVWSPDGSQVAVLSDDGDKWEIFTVNRDGLATQWIEITMKSRIYSSLNAEGFKWSPNGRYLAFFSENLYVLDMVEHRVYDLCIPSGEWSVTIQNALTWSPDSKQVLFQRNEVPALVVDLESNRAASLIDDITMRPLGWLAAP